MTGEMDMLNLRANLLNQARDQARVCGQPGDAEFIARMFKTFYDLVVNETEVTGPEKEDLKVEIPVKVRKAKQDKSDIFV